MRTTRTLILLLLSSLLLLNPSAYADTPIPGNFAIHIAQRHYEHPVRLLHPYIDVWHMKGPALEKIAREELPHHFANANMCADSHDADAVISLEPQIFYNAQVRLFYVEIFAKVYTQSTTPVVSVKAEVKQVGELSILPEYPIGKAYQAALQQVLQKLQNEQAFHSAAASPSAQHRAETLCPLLELLPSSRIYY